MRKSYKRLEMTAALLSLCGALSACSDKPTVSDVERDMALPECPGIQAFDFKKINGQDIGDKLHYNIEVSYKIKVLDPENICNDKTINDMTRLGFLAMAQKSGINFTRGAIIPVQEVKVMIKTDNGWIIDSGA